VCSEYTGLGIERSGLSIGDGGWSFVGKVCRCAMGSKRMEETFGKFKRSLKITCEPLSTYLYLVSDTLCHPEALARFRFYTRYHGYILLLSR